jgi:hypothetical protein
MAKNSNIKIYLQAQGAHYLGAHALNVSDITIQLVYSGGTIDMPYPVTPNFTDDGNPSTTFTSGASSFMPIMTVPQGPSQPNTLVNFLSPDFTTVCGTAQITLPNQPEMAALHISVPTSANVPMLIQHPVLLNPYQPEYAITVVIPGLYLSANKAKGMVSVFVKMMCGCPVTMGPPASLWPANDFTVLANVTDKSGLTTSYALTYDATQKGNSLFSAPLLPDQKPIKSVVFTAVQKSTGNYGVLSM